MSKNKIIIYCYSISLNGTLVIVNCQLFWAFRLRRRAFRYIFARSTSTPLPKSRPIPNSRPRSQKKLAKDAAPIPNAWRLL